MLDKLHGLFTENHLRQATEVMVGVINMAEGLFARVGEDPAKLNECIEIIKQLLDQQKK
jgi:hypothetical protein